MSVTTDVIVIGAGPCGLFAVFEAGLLKWQCHVFDYLPVPGGQCAEIYPKKPIYDIPGHPEILAGDLIDKLLQQCVPFKPTFTLGERVDELEKLESGLFRVRTSLGTEAIGKTVILAGGLGCFEPRKPQLDRLAFFEGQGVEYIIKDPDIYAGKHVLIAGGGDSAVDWAHALTNSAASVTLVHRSQSFRAAPDSVEKVLALAEAGKLSIVTNANITSLIGADRLSGVMVTDNHGTSTQYDVDHFIPLFGLSPKLGPIAEWGLAIEKNAVSVDPTTFQTSVEGIYAIGDIAEYQNKIRLILCGFHEATMALNVEYQRQHPDKKHIVKHTSVTGITGLA